MNYLLNRIRVYSLYFFEYLRNGAWGSAINAVLYMLTRKSFARGGKIRSSMGMFETRPATLDFQYINYAYEIDLKHFIEQSDFDVFFDIGACLGEYCIWLSGKGHRCFAFEPVKESYDMICRNIALNGMKDRITAFNYGLGSKYSIEHFSINKTNPGASKRVNEAAAGTQKFEIQALDEVFQSYGLTPDTRILVKIDVEGMEVEMLRGAAAFFKYFKHITLIIEEKLSGESEIIHTLNAICPFEYGHVDRFNIFARKKSA